MPPRKTETAFGVAIAGLSPTSSLWVTVRITVGLFTVRRTGEERCKKAVQAGLAKYCSLRKSGIGHSLTHSRSYTVEFCHHVLDTF